MEPEIKLAITKTILLLMALLGVGSVAIGVFGDEGIASETLLGVLILVTLIIVLVVSFLPRRQ
ncbi:MAG: hypothetical protein ABSB83_06200 [Methanomassiliicoccales archaeon]|jgi:hypothetical protein